MHLFYQLVVGQTRNILNLVRENNANQIDTVLYKERVGLGAHYHERNIEGLNVTYFETRSYEDYGREKEKEKEKEKLTSLDRFDISLIQSLHYISMSNDKLEKDKFGMMESILRHIPDLSALVVIKSIPVVVKSSALLILSGNSEYRVSHLGKLDRPECFEYFRNGFVDHILADTTFQWIDNYLLPLSMFEAGFRKTVLESVHQKIMKMRKGFGADYQNSSHTKYRQYSHHRAAADRLFIFDQILFKSLQKVMELEDNSGIGAIFIRNISDLREPFLKDSGVSTTVTSLIASSSGHNIDIDIDYEHYFQDFLQQIMLNGSSNWTWIKTHLYLLFRLPESIQTTVVSGLDEEIKNYRIGLGAVYGNVVFEGYQVTTPSPTTSTRTKSEGKLNALEGFDVKIVETFIKLYNNPDTLISKLFTKMLFNHISDVKMRISSSPTSVLEIIIKSRPKFALNHPDFVQIFEEEDFFSVFTVDEFEDIKVIKERIQFLEYFSEEIQMNVIENLSAKIKAHRVSLGAQYHESESESETELWAAVYGQFEQEEHEQGNEQEHEHKHEHEQAREHEQEHDLKTFERNILRIFEVCLENSISFIQMLLSHIPNLMCTYDPDDYGVQSALSLLVENEQVGCLFVGKINHPDYLKFYQNFYSVVSTLTTREEDQIISFVRPFHLFSKVIKWNIVTQLNIYLTQNHQNQQEQEEKVVSLVKSFELIAQFNGTIPILDCLINHIPNLSLRTKSGSGRSVFEVIEREGLTKYYFNHLNRKELSDYFNEADFITSIIRDDKYGVISSVNRFCLFNYESQTKIIDNWNKVITKHRIQLGAPSDYLNTSFGRINAHYCSFSSELEGFDKKLLDVLKTIIVNTINMGPAMLFVKMVLSHTFDLAVLELIFFKMAGDATLKNDLQGTIIQEDRFESVCIDFINSEFSLQNVTWLLSISKFLFFASVPIQNRVIRVLDDRISSSIQDIRMNQYQYKESSGFESGVDKMMVVAYDKTARDSAILNIFVRLVGKDDGDDNSLLLPLLKMLTNHIPNLDMKSTTTTQFTAFQGILNNPVILKGFIASINRPEYTEQHFNFQGFLSDPSAFIEHLFLFTPKIQETVINSLNENILKYRQDLGASYLENLDGNLVTSHEMRTFNTETERENSTQSLLFIDGILLKALKTIADLQCYNNSNDKDTTINIDFFAMVLNHLPDLGAMFHDFSAISIIAKNKVLLERFRGKLYRNEYLLYFEELLNLNLNFDGKIDEHLVGLSLFIAEIQSTVICEFVLKFPNTKNLLLQLVILYRFAEQVFHDLFDAGAQLLVMTKEEYENSDDVSDVIIFADSKLHVPSEALELQDLKKVVYVDFKMFANFLSDQKSNYHHVVLKEMEMKGLSSEVSTLKTAFQYYSTEVLMKLVEMSSYQAQTKYNLAYLIAKDPVKHADAPPIEDLVDSGAALERLEDGIAEIVAIALLSKLSDRFDYLYIVMSFLEKSKLAEGCCYDDKEYLEELGLVWFLPKDSLGEMILTACRFNLPDDAFLLLLDACQSRQSSTSATYKIFEDAMQICDSASAGNELVFKSLLLRDKLEFLKEKRVDEDRIRLIDMGMNIWI